MAGTRAGARAVLAAGALTLAALTACSDGSAPVCPLSLRVPGVAVDARPYADRRPSAAQVRVCPTRHSPAHRCDSAPLGRRHTDLLELGNRPPGPMRVVLEVVDHHGRVLFAHQLRVTVPRAGRDAETCQPVGDVNVRLDIAGHLRVG